MNTLNRILICVLAGNLVIVQSVHGLTQHSSKSSTSRLQPNEPDGQHDFDFEIGTWKTHLRRMAHPLTGSTTWIEYDGTTVVRKVWNGRANLVELEADGSGGHFEGLNLRLYNPDTHQWSLNFAGSSGGAVSQPTIGEFKNGHGEFFDPGNTEWPSHLRAICDIGNHPGLVPF
jgi:hypothetical protein